MAIHSAVNSDENIADMSFFNGDVCHSRSNQRPGQPQQPGVVIVIESNPQAEAPQAPRQTITITPDASPPRVADYFVADIDANEFPGA